MGKKHAITIITAVIAVKVIIMAINNIIFINTIIVAKSVIKIIYNIRFKITIKPAFVDF